MDQKAPAEGGHRGFLEAKADLAEINALFEAARAGAPGLSLFLAAAELRDRLVRALRT